MRFLIAISVPILVGETCLFFFTIGSDESNQYQYCNHTTCTYEASADYADCKNHDLVQIPPQCSSAVYLDLRKNDIRYIGYTSLSKFKNVKYLYLDGNQIRNITPRAFAECTSLQQLFLQNNPISIIQSEAFAGLANLRHLYLNLADLHVIQIRAFDDLKALQRLYLSDNSLESLPPYLFQELQNLQILTLANNGLRTLPSNAFQGLIRLEYLDIKQNRLTVLSNGLFNNMFLLIRLTLSFNAIHTIEKGAIDYDHLPSLDTLDMRDNNIISVRNFSKNFPAIPKLYLANNPIHCDCHNIDGLLMWYKLHHGELETGVKATCNSPPAFTGKFVSDITPNITLPCEPISKLSSTNVPRAKTTSLKTSDNFSTAMFTHDDPEAFPYIPSDATTTILTNDVTTDLKGIVAHQNDKDEQSKAKQNSTVKYTGIGIVVATTIIVAMIFLLVLKKCKGPCKRKRTNSDQFRYRSATLESQPGNTTPHPPQEEEIYEQVPESESISLSNTNQESPLSTPTSPVSQNDDASFPFLPPSPSQATTSQQAPLTTNYIPHASMNYPQDHQSSAQLQVPLMHSVSEPSHSHPDKNNVSQNSHAVQLPDVAHSANMSQENHSAHPYAVQILGQPTPLVHNSDQNNQIDHNFDSIAAPNQSLPNHQMEGQTPPIPLPDVQGYCRCPIAHLPYTNPFCSQNNVNIHNNPICT